MSIHRSKPPFFSHFISDNPLAEKQRGGEERASPSIQHDGKGKDIFALSRHFFFIPHTHF